MFNNKNLERHSYPYLFVNSGQQEVNHLCRRLRETFPVVKTTVNQSDKEEVEGSLLRKTKKKNLKDISNQLIKEAVNLDNYSALPLAEMEGDDPHYNDDSDMGEYTLLSLILFLKLIQNTFSTKHVIQRKVKSSILPRMSKNKVK